MAVRPSTRPRSSAARFQCSTTVGVRATEQDLTDAHNQAARAGAAGDTTRMLAPLVEPALADLAARLASMPGLSAADRAAVVAGATTAVHTVVWANVSRTVLRELHA